MSENLRGSIDLLKYENSCVVALKSKATGTTKRGVFIPLKENDVYVTEDEQHKATHAFAGLLINQRREPSQYGKTHYCKQSLSKLFIESDKELAAKRSQVYLGDFEPYNFEGGNASERISTEEAESEEELPF